MKHDEQIAWRLASNLSSAISSDVQDKLTSIRRAALECHNKSTRTSLIGHASLALLGFPGLLRQLTMIAALLVSLFGVHLYASIDNAQELAGIDSELLTDVLPIEALTDPGFKAFLAESER